jgi:hypothetical protein
VRCGNPERGEEMPSRIGSRDVLHARARAIGDTVIAFSPTAHAALKQVLKPYFYSLRPYESY